MITNINRGYLFKRSLLLIFSLFWLSCEEEREIDYPATEAVNQQIADPFIQVTTPVVGFQAGTPSYEFAFNAINGLKPLTEVKVYSTFTDAESGKESNEVLLETFPVQGPNRNKLTGTVTYQDLKEGLTVNGGPLPASDVDLKVGSGWKLRFEGTNASGETVRLPGTINVAVLSRFAGLYKTSQTSYYRIGVLTATWDNQVRFIGSVDENTFSYNDFWGNFAWTGQRFEFDIDFTTNKINVPLGGGLFSGTSRMNCTTGASEFIVQPCAGSNILIPDDVTGKHKMILTYGYFNGADGGTREFREVLEKIVD